MLHLDTGNTAFMLLCASLVMLMTPGLAFFYGGLVGRKNVLAIMMQSFVSMGWTTVIWFGVGYSLCFSGGAGMYVNESQNIAFDKMTRIDVLRSDVALSAGGRASLRIAFVDGSTMEATITSGCSFFGETAQGRFELYPDRLKSIEFIR